MAYLIIAFCFVLDDNFALLPVYRVLDYDLLQAVKGHQLWVDLQQLSDFEEAD